MQTGLRGRDLISLSGVDDRGDRDRPRGRRDPQARAGPRASATRSCATGAGDALLLQLDPDAGLVRGGHGPARRARPVHREPHDADRARRHAEGDRRDPRPLQRRHRHPPRRLGRGQPYIREVAEASRVPVLNMQCDLFHPHQILADLLTMREKLGELRGRTLTVSWAYAASYQKPISVPQDLVTAATRFGMNVRLVHPPEFRLMPEVVDEARPTPARRAARSSSWTTSTPASAVRRRLRQELGRAADREGRGRGRRDRRRHTDWITDERRMALAADDAIYMHPLPADRNVEVADAVIDSPAVGRLRRGREPAPRPEGRHGPDDALKERPMARACWWSRSAATA
jgi:hypothetical protein